MHPSPKGQTWVQSYKPAFETAFWDGFLLFKRFPYTNAWCRWTKGVNMKIFEVYSIEEHWSALKNPANISCMAAGTPGRDGLWTPSWCLMITACRKAAHGFRLPADVSEGIGGNNVHASVNCLTYSHASSASFQWLVDLQDDLVFGHNNYASASQTPSGRNVSEKRGLTTVGSC